MCDQPENEQPAGNLPPVEDRLVTSQHSITIDEKTVDYTATAGSFVLREEDEEGRAKPAT